MRIEIGDEVAEAYPDLAFAFVKIANSRDYNHESERSQKRCKLVADVTAKYQSPEVLLDDPANEAYKEFYRSMGLKPKRVSTPVKQAGRVLKTNHYAGVHRVIDHCMHVEYIDLVSFQVYDLSKLSSPLRYSFALGDEVIRTFRDEDRVCKRGELILSDSGGVMHSAYYGNNWKRALGPDTTDALVRVMQIPGIGSDRFESALGELIGFFDETSVARLGFDKRSASI